MSCYEVNHTIACTKVVAYQGLAKLDKTFSLSRLHKYHSHTEYISLNTLSSIPQRRPIYVINQVEEGMGKSALARTGAIPSQHDLHARKNFNFTNPGLSNVLRKAKGS